VKVKRPGLTVMFRHGYYGRDRLMPLDRRSFITFNRVMAAAMEGAEVKDLKVSAKVSASPGEGGALTAYVGVLVDLSGVSFKQDGDRRVATLAVTVFCSDSKEELIGESWQKADLAVKEETYQRLLRDGYVQRAVVPLKGKLGYVKAVVRLRRRRRRQRHCQGEVDAPEHDERRIVLTSLRDDLERRHILGGRVAQLRANAEQISALPQAPDGQLESRAPPGQLGDGERRDSLAFRAQEFRADRQGLGSARRVHLQLDEHAVGLPERAEGARRRVGIGLERLELGQ